MSDVVSELSIKVNAEASKANDAIDILVGKLDRLTDSLNKVQGSNLLGLAKGVQMLGNAMQVMNNVKTSDFTRLTTNLSRLGKIDTASLNNAASSMSHLTRAFNTLGGVSQNAIQISELSKNISKLGNKSVQNAITNIPMLAKALNGLMTTLSKSPKVSQNVIKLTSSLANLSAQGSKVGSVSKSIVNGLNSTTSATKKASSGFKGLASYIGKFYANYFMVVRGIKKLRSSIEGTADYIEAYNYFNVAMGKIGKDWGYQYEKYGYENAESYGESFSKRASESLSKLSGVQVSIGEDGKGLLTESGTKNLGLNIQEITQYASQLASVTNSIGQTGEVSLATSSAFTKLAGDISSLFNVDYSSVAQNLQSGLIGQSRALYKYGIDITNATLSTYAYNLGLSKSVSEMTQAEKMQLRMIAILDQSKVSWGDLANTINSPSNMLRQFTNNLKESGMVLGQLFIPLLQKVMPVVNGATIAIKRLLASIAGIMGIKIDFNAFGQNYTEISEDIDDISDSLNDVTESAKKANKGLRAFDELKVINTSSNSGGAESSTTGSSIDLTKNILQATKEYENAWQKAYNQMENESQKWADRIANVFKNEKFEELGENISNSLTNGLSSIEWSKVYKSFENFGFGIASFLNGLISPELFGSVGNTIASALNIAIYSSLSFGQTFDFTNLGESIASGINNFFSTFNFGELANTIDTWVQGIFTSIKTALENIEWSTVWEGIKKFFSELDIETIEIIIGVIIIKKIINAILGEGVITWLSTKISSLITNVPIVLSNIKILASGGLVKETGVFSKLANALALAAGGAGTLNEALIATFGTVATTIAGITAIIGGAILGVSSFFSMWQDGFSWLKEALMLLGISIVAIGAVVLGAPIAIAAAVAAIVGIVATIAVVLHDNWDAICKWVSGIPEWFNQHIIIPVKEFFEGICEDILMFFDNLWNNIKSIWNKVTGWFKENVTEPIVNFFDDLKKKILKFFSELWNNIKKIWDKASNWFKENVTEPISGFFSKLWEDIKKVWKNVTGWFKEKIITPVSNAFETACDKISGFFTTLWSGIKNTFSKVFDSLVSIIKKPLNLIIGSINTMLSGIEKGINFIVKAVNKLSFKVPDWVPGIGGKKFGFDLNEVKFNKIQYLEKGGFPDKSSIFVAGENGIPEMLGTVGGKTAVAGGKEITGISDAIRETSSEEIILLKQQNALLQEIVNKEFGISQNDIGKAAQNYANNYYKRTGKEAYSF